MQMPESIPDSMFAPCGMNCLLCDAHLRKKKTCAGCRGADETKPLHCRKCSIKGCTADHQVELCVDCTKFP